MTSLLFGLAVSVYGVAVWVDARFPQWVGVLALVRGIPTSAAGIMIAFTGFSNLVMGINLPAGVLLIMTMILLGICGWRQPIF